MLSCTCWPFQFLLWKNMYSDSPPIFKSDCLFSCCREIQFSYIFWILAAYKMNSFLVISPIPLVAFYFFECFLCDAEVLLFHVYFCSCCLCFPCHIQEALPSLMVKTYFSVFSLGVLWFQVSYSSR